MKKAVRLAIDTNVAQLLVQSKIVSPPVDLDAVAKHLGVPIYVRSLPKGIYGFLHRDGPNALIAINSKQPKTRQRFTIAHEIGHLILDHKANQVHVDKGFSLRFRAESAPSDPEETQANFFAGSLLMPEAFIKKDLEEVERNGAIDDGVLLQLQERYKVSMQALIIRLNTLKYTLTLSM